MAREGVYLERQQRRCERQADEDDAHDQSGDRDGDLRHAKGLALVRSSVDKGRNVVVSVLFGPAAERKDEEVEDIGEECCHQGCHQHAQKLNGEHRVCSAQLEQPRNVRSIQDRHQHQDPGNHEEGPRGHGLIHHAKEELDEVEFACNSCHLPRPADLREDERAEDLAGIDQHEQDGPAKRPHPAVLVGAFEHDVEDPVDCVQNPRQPHPEKHHLSLGQSSPLGAPPLAPSPAVPEPGPPPEPD
mmetsp:Transcript_21200/g.52138  ORF Transcript_21200/g.52138 Transcript_21200/m.52138 type:complete len:244 (-) Transcript_21200:192-923(-)